MILSAVLSLACMACTDRGPNLPDVGTARAVTQELRCNVHVQSGTLSCAEQGPGAGGDASLAILGGTSVKLRSANLAYDSTTLEYGFDATVQNLLGYPIGTPNGVTRTGIKVFFEKTPYVTVYKAPGDTGSVTLLNTDGAQNFTGANQPYFLYDTILTSQQISDARRWKFRVPLTVQNFGFSVRVFTATTAEVQVGLSPPESTPRRYFRAASWRECNISGVGRCVFDAVMVGFKPGTPQEERQAALNVVGGTVEGGLQYVGIYYVRIARDTTLVQLRNALTALRALPQVDFAEPYADIEVTSAYRRANDDADWESWRLEDSLSDGRNWNLEAISAPLAWGCDTGSIVTPVAIVDHDFHRVPDLTANTFAQDTLVDDLTAAADSGDHGTLTASVFGAQGNNNVEMTGLNWRAEMRLYEVATVDTLGNILRTAGQPVMPLSRIANLVARAGTDGASVINVSMELSWNGYARGRGWVGPLQTYNPATEANPQRLLAIDSLVRRTRAIMIRAVRQAQAAGRNPLVVLAAGNQGMQARFNAFTQAVDSLPDNFIVVGAGGRIAGSGNLQAAGFTNFGNEVEIAAPGVAVWALNRNGQQQVSGTSFAAPLVAGTAALLASFDPRLQQNPGTLKQLILEGAQSGRRTMENGAGGTDTIPVLNAHEALKAAARRAGAPMCGNRVWVANQTFYIQRDTTSQAGEPQFAVVDPTSTRAVRFNAMHGGKQVMLYTRLVSNRSGRQWSPTGWTTIPFSDTGPNNASFLSRAGQSHDGDSTVVLDEVAAPAQMRSFQVAVRTGGTSTSVGPIISDTAYQSTSRLCASTYVGVSPEEHESKTGTSANDTLRSAYFEWLSQRSVGECMGDGPPVSGADSYQSIAYSPTGRQAYAFFVHHRSSSQNTGSRACTRPGDLYWNGVRVATVFYKANCITSVTTTVSAGTTVYRIDLVAGTVHVLPWGEATAELFLPQIRENGRELHVERSTYRNETTWGWADNMNNFAEATQSLNTTHPCALQFRDLAAGTVILSPGPCGLGGGQGGFSAVRGTK